VPSLNENISDRFNTFISLPQYHYHILMVNPNVSDVQEFP
jgi:hypothetical protein